MLDGRPDDGFTDQEADAITAQCDPNITPIFPVRYALTLDALTAFRNSTPNLTAPSGLGGGHHDLRRLRRGYVYIYAASGHTEDMHSDQDGKWLVFRYETDPQDVNSQTQRSDTPTSLPGAYAFTQYEWEDGTPSGPWTANHMRRFPYAFVHRDVTDVFIAYSEERWPAYFFERMAQDGAIRSKLMTQVNLTAEQTAYSAPLSNIGDFVRGFNDDPIDPAENPLRQTTLENEDQGTVVNCPNAFDNGRVVAVQDPLGEILDLGRIHDVLAQTQRSYAANYAYPLTIGAAVKQHEDQIRSDTEGGIRGALRNNPIHDDFAATYDALLQEQESIDASLDAITQGILQVIMREGPGGVLEEHTIAFEGIDGIADESQFERAEYGSYIMARALENLGASNRGSQALMAVVDPARSTDDASRLHEAFVETMKVYRAFDWEIATPIVRSWTNSKAPHFDYLINVTANEVAVHWVRGVSGDPYFVKQAVGAVTLVRESGRAGVHPSQLDGFLRNSFRNLGFANIDMRSASQQGASVQGIGSFENITPADMITTRRFTQGSFSEFSNITATVDVTLNPGSVGGLAVEGNVQRIGTGAGVLFAMVIAFDSRNSWNQTRFTLTTAGAIAENPIAVTGSALADVLASTVQWREIRNTSAYTNRMSQQVFSKLFSAGTYLRPDTASTTARNVARGIGRPSIGTILGRVAGAIGIVLSGLGAWEAFMVGDRAGVIGNVLLAVGGLITLFAVGGIFGLILGFALIVIGAIILFFRYSPLEKWVAMSFWGDSRSYWNNSRRGTSIQQKIETARALADPSSLRHDEIQTFFEEELRAYAQIMTPPKIHNAVPGDFTVEIEYQFIETPADLAESDIEVRMDFRQQQSGQFLMHGISSQYPDRLSLQFVSPGIVRAVIGQRHRDMIAGENAGLPANREIVEARVRCTADGKQAPSRIFSYPP